MVKKTIIADAGPLIAFGRINSLSLLTDTLGTIVVPQAVADECLIDFSRAGSIAIQKAINNNSIKLRENPKTDNHQSLFDILGNGEANAIVLALELKSGLLIDEKLGRRAAKKLKLKIIGTAGVLLLAKQHKLVLKISPLINELKKVGYYLSDNLINEVLKQAKEEPGS